MWTTTLRCRHSDNTQAITSPPNSPGAPEAAMRVYYCSTRGSARVMAHKNLNNPKVLAYLDQLIGFTFDRELLDRWRKGGGVCPRLECAIQSL